MFYSLEVIKEKQKLNQLIQTTRDKVLVLRFGQMTDPTCQQWDYLLDKSSELLRLMAKIVFIEIPIEWSLTQSIDQGLLDYIQYFDIQFIPSTIFFFNGHHMKVDYGMPDHTKLVGPLKSQQDLIDLIETIYRGALRGKTIVQCPFPKGRLMPYELLYHGY